MSRNPEAWRAYVAHLARTVAQRYEAQLWRMETLMRSPDLRDDEYRVMLGLPGGRRIEISFDAAELAELHERSAVGLAAFVEERIERALKSDGDERVQALARGFDETWRPTDHE